MGESLLDGGGVPVFVIEAVIGGGERAAGNRGNVVDFVEDVQTLKLEHAGGGEVGGARAAAGDGDADEVVVHFCGIGGVCGGAVGGDGGDGTNDAAGGEGVATHGDRDGLAAGGAAG